MEVDTY
ncbi:Protein of unknown function [Bacillus cereus]|nr:Protein of unknown function [Bacillus cereus]